MSDTPRTDAMVGCGEDFAVCVPVNFARELESEVARLNMERLTLRAENARLQSVMGLRCLENLGKLESTFTGLRTELEALADIIDECNRDDPRTKKARVLLAAL